MDENAREYLNKKFELASNCLAKTVEYNKLQAEFPPDSASDEEYNTWLLKRENTLRDIWTPLTDFQKLHPQEPNYYIKKDTFYARVFFTPGIEDVHYIITDEKIPARFIKNQVKRDPWSVVITQDFINRYTILHMTWFVSIMKIGKPGVPIQQEDPFKNFEFPDFIPKCKHCRRHYTKLQPNQKYCETCQHTVKKWDSIPSLIKTAIDIA